MNDNKENGQNDDGRHSVLSNWKNACLFEQFCEGLVNDVDDTLMVRFLFERHCYLYRR